MVRVLVADDHEPFLEAARAVVDATPGFELVAEARTGEEAVTLATALGVDVAILDINMPGLSGIEAARRILTYRPSTRAVLVSTYADADVPAAARDSGATYLRKQKFGPRTLAALA
jgi:DNA-binding NarL/FixJ family response regulator